MSAVSLFQRNKQLYVEEENKLEAIISDSSFLQVFQTWLNTNISQLDFQYERCEQQLSELQQNVAVSEGSFWCSKTIIDHCNLHMAERRLVKKGEYLEDHAQLPELIHLISCLQQIKSHSFMTPKQRRFIEQVEEELKTVVLSPRELLFITNALQTKLRDDGNTRGVFGDLTSFQNTIEDLSPDIDQCEQLLEASIANGEMGLAEDISRRQLEIFEHILKLITDQYPAISNYYSESRNSDRGRRWAIFRMADKDITAVIEGKYRQIEACEEDLVKIRDQIDNYNSDDSEQRKRYEKDRNESDQFLLENKEKQQSIWNRIFELFKELEGCVTDLSAQASKRRKEVDRRLQMEEREAGRRSGHESFIQAAAVHAQKLQDTIDNALAVKDIAQALNNFVLDGCDSITAKYDKQQNALSEMLRLVQQHHFRRFSDYYIAASRYLYRKERRLEQIEAEMDTNDMKRELHSESLNPNAKEYAEANNALALKRREVAQEVLHIRHKLEKAEKAIGPTLRSLDFAGVAYTHPHEIVSKMNLNRWSTILDFREAVDPAIPQMERVRREEIETLRRLREYVDHNASQHSQRLRLPHDHKGAPQSAFAKRVHAMLEKQLPCGTATQPSLLPAVNIGTSTATSSSTAASQPTAGRSGGAAAAASTATTTAATTSKGKDQHQHQQQYGGTGTAAATAVGPSTDAQQQQEQLPPIFPTRMEGTTFRAMYAYKARAPDELSFEEGHKIVCISRAPEEGWFKGVCNQRTGLFPINYVEPCREDA
eukprot:gene10346-7239_t